MTDKPKMATGPNTPPGLELDGHGNQIPFERRAEGDKQKVRDNVAAAINGSTGSSTKNPNNEAEIPAPMPQGEAGTKKPSDVPHDLEGQQGGTKGTGRE